MKKVLITGANGLLGQKLVALLLAEGEFAVLATGRGPSRMVVPDASVPYAYHALDIANGAAVQTKFAEWQPDLVVNTAAMTHVDQCEQDPAGCHEANVTAVAHLVAACEAQGAFLLHLSTDFIFDGTSGPYDETDVPNPLSHYGQSKLDAERLVTASTLRWAIARTVLVYGIAPGLSRSNIVLWVKNSLEAGKPIRVVDDQFRSPTLAEDLAIGCRLILQREATGIFNISGPDFLTPYEMALQTADYFGLDRGLITRTDSTQFTQPARRPPRTGFVLDKARRELAYAPRSFEAGIAVLARQLTPASE